MQKITFTTNVGKNTLEYLKLLLRSLQVNLDYDEHEILVFVDQDNEGILEYLLQVKGDFKDLTIIKNNAPIPVGYAVNKTILTKYAKHDIISYLQSDMVIGPHYDTEILKHIKPGRILSSTRVEPPLHGESPVTITKDFGVRPSDFKFDDWNTFSLSVRDSTLISYFFAPITYYKQDWLNLGGYDTIFRRSREDSDLVQRCLHAGIELTQTFSANVYHFTCVSSRGSNWFDKTNREAQERVQLQNVADMIELRRFLRKWGNFNHGESKLYKYDIDVLVKNYSVSQIYNIEPFFERVWLENESDVSVLTDVYKKDYDVSNKLYGCTNEVWESYKTIYRLDDIKSKIKVGVPKEYSVLVTIDFAKIISSNAFLNNLQHLYSILSDAGVGEYELDNVQVSIKHLSVIDTPITTINPEVNNSLLTLY